MKPVGEDGIRGSVQGSGISVSVGYVYNYKFYVDKIESSCYLS